MDCYDTESDLIDRVLKGSSTKIVAASVLIPALQYFIIPDELRPPGARMAARLLEARREHKEHLIGLLNEQIKVSSSNLLMIAHCTAYAFNTQHILRTSPQLY